MLKSTELLQKELNKHNCVSSLKNESDIKAVHNDTDSSKSEEIRFYIDNDLNKLPKITINSDKNLPPNSEKLFEVETNFTPISKSYVEKFKA